MTYRRPGHAHAPSRRPTAPVRSRGEWRLFVGKARECARHAAEGVQDERALLALRDQVRDAQTGMFQRDLGFAVCEVANAFVVLARAFTAPTTPPALRERMAGQVESHAGLLDGFLDDLQARAQASSRDNGRADLN